jgi:hypothetical protein
MRGVHGSSAAGHDINSVLYHLQKKLFIVPFTKDFFGSPASGSYSYPVLLADARIASAEVYATNSRGNGPITAKCLTGLTDDGLRTYSGGQISIQVEGYLAIQASAAPPLVIEAAHAVRDIFAVVGEAPTGGAIELRLRQDDEVYCPPLTIPVTPAGTTISNVINGFGLAPLRAGARLCLDITSVAQTADSTPGRDLTVTIRL